MATYDKSTGYRKIPGDVCVGGVENTLEPQLFSCCESKSTAKQPTVSPGTKQPTTNSGTKQPTTANKPTGSGGALSNTSQTVTISVLGSLLGIVILVAIVLAILAVIFAL